MEEKEKIKNPDEEIKNPETVPEKEEDENSEQETKETSSEDNQKEEKTEESVSETDNLKSENLRLKTQLEALKIGFTADCLEDAVLLAENIVKRDGTDIKSALQSVAKKYPDWKSSDSKENKSKSGFKIGADSSGGKMEDSSKLDKAFGIRKK